MRSRIHTRRIGALLWTAGVSVVGALAAVAALSLAGMINQLWAAFPGSLGISGWLIALTGLAAGLLGLWLVLRLPVRWGVVLGVVLLVGLRLAAVASIDPPLERDPSAYDRLARSVLAGQCCFDFRPMGYPMLIAATYALGLSAKVVSLLAAVVGGPLVWVLARRLGGARAGAVALYLYATTPSLTLLNGVLLTEPLYATLLLGCLACVAAPASAGRKRHMGWLPAAAGGLTLGLSQYVRSTSIFLLPALVLPLVTRRAYGLLAAVVLLFLLALLPVIAATGGPFTSPLGGWSMLTGTNQQHDGQYNDDDVSLYSAWGANAERLARDEALRRIAADPAGIAALALRKVHVLWASEGYAVYFAFGGTDVEQPVRDGLRLLSQSWYVPVLGAAVVALWRMRRRPPDLAVNMLGLMLTVAAMHLLVEVQGRYHAYLLPLLAILAASLVGDAAWGLRPGGRTDAVGTGDPALESSARP